MDLEWAIPGPLGAAMGESMSDGKSGESVDLETLMAQQRRLVTTGPEASVRAVAEAMAEAREGCAVVLESGRLIGVLTERDLVWRVLVKKRDLDRTRVSEVMSRDVVVGRTGDSVAQAAFLMRRHHIRHLPVMDKKGALVGVVPILELLREEIQGMRDYIGESEG